jgi:hypothetical protein
MWALACRHNLSTATDHLDGSGLAILGESPADLLVI